ncbi:MAG TPA: hypothetical protein VGC95_13180, partial [Chitinophagaceae bacterium]
MENKFFMLQSRNSTGPAPSMPSPLGNRSGAQSNPSGLLDFAIYENGTELTHDSSGGLSERRCSRPFRPICLLNSDLSAFFSSVGRKIKNVPFLETACLFK